MSNPHTTTRRSGPGARRRPNQWLIVGAVLICLAFGLIVAARIVFSTRKSELRAGDNLASSAASSTSTAAVTKAPSSRGDVRSGELLLLVDDDEQTLWVSPTDGPPLDLAYLPPGCQVIVALRWSDLFRHDDGVKLVDALHPVIVRGLKSLGKDLLGVLGGKGNPFVLPHMVIGSHLDTAGARSMSRVVYYRPFSEANLEWLREAYSEEAHGTHRGERYGIIDELAYYFPDPPHAARVVIAPEHLIGDVLDLAGEPPPLRRDMERLLTHTDADRVLTILFMPNSLFGEGRGLFTGQWVGLREGLFWFLGDEFSAVAFSMHWGEDFFVELLATPTLDTPPERAARILMERVRQVPSKVEQYIAGLDTQPYGREVLARFPAMLGTMVDYTRADVENDIVVLRCYLPAVAGHNLLAGAELTLAERPGGVRTVAEATAPSNAASTGTESVRERLRRITSLRFARDTLDAALEQLAQDVGVEIVIRGADLQAEGITKNQSFGIDLASQPAEEILVEILRLANPDKTAAGPDDSRQKLVYVISPSRPGGAEQVVVTTRAAAAERGEELPPVFTRQRP